MKKVCVLFLLMFSSPVFASGINANSASAPCTNTTLETYSGNTNLAADWQPNEINLRWYNEDQKLTVQSSAQSCTYDGTLTVPSTQPTRTGYTFAGWEVKYTIPAGYTELEYVESSGTQRINTNIMVHSGISVEAVVQGKSGTERSVFLGFGCDKSGTYIADDGTQFYMTYFWSGISSLNKTLVTSTWVGNNGEITQTGTIGNKSMAPYTSSVISYDYLKFFGCSAGGSNWSGRFYYVKVYDNGTLSNNFIPARRNSDNAVGFYDTVSETFKTNSGTGTFIAGPAVQ